MTYEEFVGWLAFFDKRPVGWREDLRSFYIMQAFGGDAKTKPYDIFPSLKPIFVEEKASSKLIKSLKKSPFLGKMIGAKGGERLKALDEI